MKFSHKHHIPASAQAAWKMTSDPDFVLDSYKKANAVHELISSEERDGKTFNKIRVSFKEALPSLASKFIGASNLSYEQHETVDHSTMRNDWEIIVPKVGSKVKATGFFQIQAQGDSCVRIVQGEVKVSIAFIGGKIEQHIAQKLGESQEEIANLLKERLS